MSLTNVACRINPSLIFVPYYLFPMSQVEFTKNCHNVDFKGLYPYTFSHFSLSSSNDLSHSKHDVIVTPSGSVTWSYQATYQVPCIITPAKMVNCSLRVWTPHYDVSEIAHVPISDVIDLSHYVTSDMYPITTSGSEEELLTMTSMSQHTYSVVRYRFSFSMN